MIQDEIPHRFADLAASACRWRGRGYQIRIRRRRPLREHQHQSFGTERLAGYQQFRLAEDVVASFARSYKQRVPQTILTLEGIKTRSKRRKRLSTVARN